MTTDLEEKFLSIQSKDEKGKKFTISAVMKGSGMIGPKMEATMLCFVLTDYNLIQTSLQDYLNKAVDVSFNMAVVDGDTLILTGELICAVAKLEAFLLKTVPLI